LANTYTLISSSTVGSGGAANIEFTSISGSYTDLALLVTCRTASGGADSVKIAFNSDTTSGNYQIKYLEGNGTNVSSGTSPSQYSVSASGSTDTASTFSNAQVYIPNYAGSNKKSWSSDTVTENNGTAAYATLIAGLWDNTSAITTIKLTTTGAANFAQYSTAYLYGIKNS
jgi:hypothetical protein